MLLDAGVPNPASVVVPILVRLEKLSMKARSQGLNVEERHNSKRRIILQFLLIVYPIWAGTDPPRLLHSSFLARQHLNRLFLFLWCNFRGETKTNIGGPMKKITCIVAAVAVGCVFSAAQNMRFEVASIKAHARVAGGPVVPQSLRLEPTRLSYANASLMRMETTRNAIEVSVIILSEPPQKTKRASDPVKPFPGAAAISGVDRANAGRRSTRN